ncbi:MAG TPA: histidine kinase dimerization/phosphoacceptor domain -containing protein [Rectinemataceae bacterium]|nr:histidine kinase dimerization/phosphoacceptor domain -containing protein [Rectinemataceae bacterium]
MVIVAAIYPVSIYFGYQQYSKSPLPEALGAMFGVACIAILYGSVILRHELRHREDKALLETRVAERTAELARALAERSVMLRELHHRVKNNLQLTASLLRLESDYPGGGSARAALEASTQRIQAMALVHETLHETKELIDIDLVGYSRSLISSVGSVGFVEFVLDAESPLGVDLDFAVPFGLLLNELVSDAERRRYPAGQVGQVRFSLGESDGILLSMESNALEHAEESAAETKAESLGVALIDVLVKQLRGESVAGTPGGPRWSLRFPRTARAAPRVGSAAEPDLP